MAAMQSGQDGRAALAPQAGAASSPPPVVLRGHHLWNLKWYLCERDAGRRPEDIAAAYRDEDAAAPVDGRYGRAFQARIIALIETIYAGRAGTVVLSDGLDAVCAGVLGEQRPRRCPQQSAACAERNYQAHDLYWIDAFGLWERRALPSAELVDLLRRAW